MLKLLILLKSAVFYFPMSMFVVPNHLTEQIGSDFMKLYPNANILVAKSDDFSPQKRRQMFARIATGNFDLQSPFPTTALLKLK